MKSVKIYLTFYLLFSALIGCTKKESSIGAALNPSYGERNEIVLVIDDSLWTSPVGDNIRSVLAQPTEGLTKEEPIFDLVQYDPKIFSNRARTSRNVVLFSVQTAQEFILQKSLYATPQNFFFVRAQTTDDLISLFCSKSDSIVSVFRASELNEEMHRIVRSSTKEVEELKNLFGCTLKLPDLYYLQAEEDVPFLWYQRDLSSGNLNIVLYEFSIEEIENEAGSIEEHLLMARNFIGEEFLKTAKEGAYLTTEAPATITREEIQHLPAYRISGNWETVNDYLEGPFICYAIRDDYYDRYLFIEGFINNPFKDKRNQLLELEAIIKTVNFNESANQNL